MSVAELLELGISSKNLMPKIENTHQIMETMRTFTANEIVAKIMELDIDEYIGVVRMTTADMTETEIVDTAAELVAYIYPELYKDILDEQHTAKTLLEVLTLCAKEVKHESDR